MSSGLVTQARAWPRRVAARTGIRALTSCPFWTISDAQQRAAEQVNFLKNVALIGATLALMYGATDWPLALT